MTAFNQIVTIIVLLALIPIVTVGLIASEEALQLLRDLLNEVDMQLGSSPSALEMLVRAVLALLVDALLVVLLYLEVRRPSETSVPMAQIASGEAQIAVDSVIDRLTYHVDPLPGVLDVVPRVIPSRRGVEVVLDIEMTADARLAANIEEISAVARRVIEDDMGLKLKGKPKLKLRTVSHPAPVGGEEPEDLAIAPMEDAAGDEIEIDTPLTDAAGEEDEPRSADASE